jgi:hypothetical protein
MSVLGGFDFLLEISNPALLALLESNLEFNGVKASPPFQMSMSSSGSTTSVIVDRLELDLKKDTVKLTFNFSDSTIATSTETFSALAGKFKLELPLIMDGSTPSLDLANATVDGPKFDAATKKKLGATATTLESEANAPLQDYFRGLGSTIPLLPDGVTFKTTSGDGELLKELVFHRVEAHVIGGSTREEEAIGIFGVLLAENDATADHTKKGATAITSGHQMCLSLSKDAFHSLILATELATVLGVKKVSDLPATFGDATSVEAFGVELKRIADTWREGDIHIAAMAGKSSGHFEVIALAVNDESELVPTVVATSVEFAIGVSGLGKLATALLLACAAALNDVVEALLAWLERVLSEVLTSLLAGMFQPVALPSFPGAAFDAVAVETYGVTINGTMATAAAATSATRSIELSGTVRTTSTSVVASGVWTDDDSEEGTLAQFPYQEIAQSQKAVYTATPTLLGTPLTYEWWIETSALVSASTSTARSATPGDESSSTVLKYPLTGSSGTVTPAVNASFVAPVPGGSLVRLDATIQYSIEDGEVKLTNAPSDGNYDFTLKVKVTDPAGYTASDSATVSFEGDTLQLAGSTAARLASRMQREWERVVPSQPSPLGSWERSESVAPEKLRELALTMLASRSVAAGRLLAMCSVVYGEQLRRALTARVGRA